MRTYDMQGTVEIVGDIRVNVLDEILVFTKLIFW